VKRRGVSFSRKQRKNSSEPDLPATSEFAAAAAAASQNTPTSSTSSSGQFKTPMAPAPNSPSRARSASSSTPSSSYRRTSAGGELRSAKQTLQDNERQARRVSQRSREMNDSAVNFASAAQGLLELSAKKKR